MLRLWRRGGSVARPLTAGEVEMARSVFGEALDCGRVRIHDRPYFPLQGRRIAMTPNGHVWFRPEDFLPDFSGDLRSAAWLVHELVHAWQFQSGRSVRLRGLVEQTSRIFGVDPYYYGRLDPNRPFGSYKNEQQATIVEDWFRLTRRLAPRHGSGAPDEYRRVIPFLPPT